MWRDQGLIRSPQGAGSLAYAMLTFDPMPLPGGDSDLLLERIARANRLFGEAGRLLWNAFAPMEAQA